MENRELYQKVMDKYGVDAQMIVAIEEVSELAKELCKAERCLGDVDHIAEEVADVEIMCEQLRFMFTIDEQVDEWKAYKLKRLADKL